MCIVIMEGDLSYSDLVALDRDDCQLCLLRVDDDQSPYCLPLACSDKDIVSCKSLVANGVDKYGMLRTEEFEVVL